jgi:predicted transcriptional regulator
MPPMHLGVMPQEALHARTQAILRGDVRPRPDDPKVWFTSMRSLAEVLREENRTLLQVMAQHSPPSMAALAQATGRAPSNLSRTLARLEMCGMVRLEREGARVRPVALATEFVVSVRN